MTIEEFYLAQESLDDEFQQILFDNLWDMYDE